MSRIPVRDGHAQRALYEREVARHLLAVWEALCRHDENLKAHRLLSECAPYFLEDDPEVETAAREQAEKVAHLTEPDAYARYYGSNPNEAPFEEMYGLPAGRAHERLPRVAYARRWLQELAEERGAALSEN